MKLWSIFTVMFMQIAQGAAGRLVGSIDPNPAAIGSRVELIFTVALDGQESINMIYCGYNQTEYKFANSLIYGPDTTNHLAFKNGAVYDGLTLEKDKVNNQFKLIFSNLKYTDSNKFGCSIIFVVNNVLQSPVTEQINLNALGGPEKCGKKLPNTTIQAKTNETTHEYTIEICGNPKPTFTWSLPGLTGQKVEGSLMNPTSRQYEYKIKVPAITSEMCKGYLRYEATGHGPTASGEVMVNVMDFTPGPVTVSTATGKKDVNKTCITKIEWKKVDAGSCDVVYEVQLLNVDQVVSEKRTSLTSVADWCVETSVAAAITQLRVRAIGANTGAFSDGTSISYAGTEKQKKNEENTERWYLIGGILGGIAFLFIIILIVVCCCLKKRRKEKKTQPRTPEKVVYSSGIREIVVDNGHAGRVDPREAGGVGFISPVMDDENWLGEKPSTDDEPKESPSSPESTTIPNGVKPKNAPDSPPNDPMYAQPDKTKKKSWQPDVDKPPAAASQAPYEGGHASTAERKHRSHHREGRSHRSDGERSKSRHRSKSREPEEENKSDTKSRRKHRPHSKNSDTESLNDAINQMTDALVESTPPPTPPTRVVTVTVTTVEPNVKAPSETSVSTTTSPINLDGSSRSSPEPSLARIPPEYAQIGDLVLRNVNNAMNEDGERNNGYSQASDPGLLYAELGPGGRQGPRNPPKESLYAQVAIDENGEPRVGEIDVDAPEGRRMTGDALEMTEGDTYTLSMVRPFNTSYNHAVEVNKRPTLPYGRPVSNQIYNQGYQRSDGESDEDDNISWDEDGSACVV